MVLIQPNMQVHEDLAALFSRHMILDPSQAARQIQEQQLQQQLQQQQQQPQAQQQQQQQQQQPAATEPKIVYSISQHYNHSAHLARQAAAAAAAAQEQQQRTTSAPSRPASEPPSSEHQATEAILSRHGVDPSALSQSQLQLFKEAGDAQKLRLLELWSICPPTNSRDNPALAWSSTSLEQEEQLARMRYEHKLLTQGDSNNDGTTMSLDGTPVPTTTTTFQGGDGRWMVVTNTHTYMEPYMSSGYEELARREYEASKPAATAQLAPPPPSAAAVAAAADGDTMMYSPFGTPVPPPTYSSATDPVYKSSIASTDWALRQKQAMEDQYGAFQSCRMEL